MGYGIQTFSFGGGLKDSLKNEEGIRCKNGSTDFGRECS